MSNGFVTNFFGGPPLTVLVKLILLSILVGVILHVVGLDPWDIISSVKRLVLRIWDMGFDAITTVWRYFLLGAVLVIPIWLIIRLVKTPKGR